MHSYRDLLADSRPAQRTAAKLDRKSWSPSLFVVHFGIKGTWPGIPHHSILFGPRYEGLLSDIYETGVLPADFSLYLHHPTVTDPSLAPEGHSTFYALAPVPHMGKFPVDWNEVGPILEKRILDEVGRRLIRCGQRFEHAAHRLRVMRVFEVRAAGHHRDASDVAQGPPPAPAQVRPARRRCGGH